MAGKRAIVTGGSRGIGRKTVDLLVAEGCHVGFCARGKAQVDSTVAEIAATDAVVIGGAVDVTDDAACRRWVADGVVTLSQI